VFVRLLETNVTMLGREVVPCWDEVMPPLMEASAARPPAAADAGALLGVSDSDRTGAESWPAPGMMMQRVWRCDEKRGREEKSRLQKKTNKRRTKLEWKSK
jgi:hypothetical protein